MKFLVLNLGLKSLRAIVFDENGNVHFKNSLSVETYINADRVEQDPNEWWEKTEKLLLEIKANKKLSADIKYMTFTSSSSCLVAVDEECKPLYNTIMVSDKRAVSESNYIKKILKNHKLDVRVDSSLLTPKILWLKKNEKKIYNKTAYFLSPNDFFIAKLSGKFITDPYNFSKVDFNNKVSKELLEDLGIDSKKLPEPRKIGSEIGDFLPKYIKHFGINPKIILTTYDAICSVYGSGISKAGDVSDVSGTVSSIRVISDREIYDEKNRVFTFKGFSEDNYLIGGSNNLGGGIIEWTKELLYPSIEDPYSLMILEAEKSKPGANGIVFLPYLLGERCPIWDPHARAVFFGLQRGHERKQMIRSIFEGIAFGVMDILETLRELKLPLKRLFVSGGLSRIELISQIKADLTGLDVYVLDDFESTSVGALIIMSISTGVYKNLEQAAEKIVRIKAVLKPNENLADLYRDIYSLYKDIYRSVKSTYKKHKKTFSKHKDILNSYQTRLHNL